MIEATRSHNQTNYVKSVWATAFSSHISFCHLLSNGLIPWISEYICDFVCIFQCVFYASSDNNSFGANVSVDKPSLNKVHFTLFWFLHYFAPTIRAPWIYDFDYYKMTNVLINVMFNQGHTNKPISLTQNASAPHPTMLHSEQKCAHFCYECSIIGYGTGAFWDLWIRSIGT